MLCIDRPIKSLRSLAPKINAENYVISRAGNNFTPLTGHVLSNLHFGWTSYQFDWTLISIFNKHNKTH